MKQYIILAAIGALLATSCKQSEIQQQFDPQQGEPIEVPLELSFERSTAISRSATEPQTTHEGALAGELSVGEIDQAQSKAVDEATVANVWVLQFDGTATTSKLIYKRYIPAYTAGSTVQLLRATTANRVAIVANTFDAAWANGFAVGTATWATVSLATKAVTAQSDVLRSSGGTDYLPMSGSTTGTPAVGVTINIPLTRTVVKVVVNLRSGADLNATAFNVQLCGVPNATSWFPDTGTGVWPASTTVINYAAESVTGITTTGFKTLTFWVPVNRRGTVASTVGLTRAKNAPAGATYLKVLFGSITYTIHLGGDFLTDYNLKGNTAYSYSLTLQTDPAQTDSRVSDLRTLGTLTQTPTNNIAAAGATVTVKSPSAMAGLIWSGSTNPAAGFAVGAFSGAGPTGSVPVTVSLNPTGAVRSSVFTATGVNGKTASLTIRQAASSLIYASTSATTPVAASATNVTFTVTGTKGLTLTLAKTGGDAAFSAPNPTTLTCNGSAQTVTVTMAANTGAAREAAYSATVTNPGASGLNLSGITVKQSRPPVNPPAEDQYVEIDGLKWTKGNLVAKNANECKVGAPTDYGLYFQFGSLVGWTGGATGDGVGASDIALAPAIQVKPATYSGGTTWATVGYCKDGTTDNRDYNLPATDDPTTGIGDPCRYYLGAPWRTPTVAQYLTLLGVDGANTNMALTLKVNNYDLSFPPVGERANSGQYWNVGSSARYCTSSVKRADMTYNLYFRKGSVSNYNYDARTYGLPTRCVASS